MTGSLNDRRHAAAHEIPEPQGRFGVVLDAVRVAARRLLGRRVASVVLSQGQGEQSACLASQAAPGWYMLELCASGRALLEAHIELRGGRGAETTQRWRFPLYSNRPCKRMILLSTSQSVWLAFGRQVGSVVLGECRLMPVTAGFARSRMVRRLTAQHPTYRQDAARAGAPLAHLWQDYCALFEAGQELVPYASWVAEFGHATTGEQAHTSAQLAALPSMPRFSIVVIATDVDGAALAASIESVECQAYPHRQLIVVMPEGAAAPTGTACVSNYLPSEGLAAGLRCAVAVANGDWIQFLSAGDLLATDALSILAASLALHPQCALAYTDEDTIDPAGVRRDPHFKPDWDIDLLHSRNYVGASALYRLALVRAVGPFSCDEGGAQLFDLLLRCAERVDTGAVCHIAHILLHRPSGQIPPVDDAGVRALHGHFGRRGIDAAVTRDDVCYRVRYPVPAPAPLVTLVIPTRNGLDLLRRCIDSIVEKTRYPNYDLIVVDNGSDDPATLRYLEQLAAQGYTRVLRDDGPFNYSALNNAAVAQARGDIVGLLNNDLEVITPEWLTEMVGHALRPDVGAVGARLWYADDTLQHAGVILGMEGTAGHLHRFLPRGQAGYQGRALATQSFSAVTGACLVVRKETYALVGGLNEADLPVTCNDIDFCLRLRELGYRNVWTPHAELYHHESSSRGLDDVGEKALRAARENAWLHQRWGALLEADPAYNPNLSLDFTDVVLAWPPRHRPSALAAGVHRELSRLPR